MAGVGSAGYVFCTQRGNRMNTAKIKLLVGGVLIAGGLGYLGYLAADASAAYAIGLKQYADAPDRYAGRGLRLAGKVAGGSWKQEGNVHTFVAHDLETCSVSIPVRYEGTLPDTFREGGNVIVEGKLDDTGTFRPTLVMAQCPSKYDSTKQNEVTCELKDTKLVQVAVQ